MSGSVPDSSGRSGNWWDHSTNTALRQKSFRLTMSILIRLTRLVCHPMMVVVYLTEQKQNNFPISSRKTRIPVPENDHIPKQAES